MGIASFGKCVFVICACLFSLISVDVEAHSMLPPEVVTFLQTNPEATEADFQAFLSETYGVSPSEGGSQITLEQAQQSLLFDPFEGALEEAHENHEALGVEEISEIANLVLSVKDPETPWTIQVRDFIVLGIEHIIFGLDHVLFVISLILVPLSWRRVLALVSTFTVAHSLTLILAGTSVLTLSGRIVEPIIAFSIAYVAITTVILKNRFFRNQSHKLGVIFLFGLFHGLGFAGVFSELQIPSENYLSALIFFNVGVEIGQVFIILLLLPALHALQKTPKAYNRTTKTIAVIISLLAVFWVIERIWF